LRPPTCVGGGQTQSQTLANAVRATASPRLPLTEPGVGKTTIARLLARAINCTNRGSRRALQRVPVPPEPGRLLLDIIEIDGFQYRLTTYATNRGS
jgi:DNA polymerase III gamma/tau subunit